MGPRSLLVIVRTCWSVFVAFVCLLLMHGSAAAQTVFATGFESKTSTSLVAAGRILNQASFGPTVADILHVEQIGVQGYVAEQLSLPAYIMPGVIPVADYNIAGHGGDCDGWACDPEAWWWQDILFGQDQLRQRVAFAISKIFVVSYSEVDPRYFPYYLNTLSKDSLGNWFDIMRDVSLSPAMGTYLNAANSTAPLSGGHANENFARELLQLFSIGINALNEDGSTQTDAHGNAIPNYTPAVVQAFARAFTGYTFANQYCSSPSTQLYYFAGNPPGQTCPMVPVKGLHDQTQKSLLRGVELPPGQDAATDFIAALHNIFEDPSLPPFICRRLIQNLVTSNPSPAYISRVAEVFIDNGKGVRGDMKSVVSAILLDPEARAEDTSAMPGATSGVMRDPILLYTSVLRALNATKNLPSPYNAIYKVALDNSLNDLAEPPHQAPSVFSYYSPDFMISTGSSSLYAPEFQIENTMSIAEMTRQMQDLLDSQFHLSNRTEFTVDFSPTSPLVYVAAHQGPLAVVNILDAVLLHGTMTTRMRDSIVAAISGSVPATMAKNAVYLVITSAQYRTMV